MLVSEVPSVIEAHNDLSDPVEPIHLSFIALSSAESHSMKSDILGYMSLNLLTFIYTPLESI